MKVGDLVKWHFMGHDPDGTHADSGLIIQLSRTGHKSLSALVLFGTKENSRVEWIQDTCLEVINEYR